MSGLGDSDAGGRSPAGLLRFDAFVFDTSLRRLYRDGAEIHLTPKASAVLSLLLHRPGELISKDEFLDSVWDGVHVREESLTQAISVIRHSLGDSAQSPKFIQTVSGEGYVFIGELAAAELAGVTGAPAASHDSSPGASDGIGRTAGRRHGQARRLGREALITAAMVIVIIGAAAWLWRPRGNPEAAPDFLTVTSYPGYENYPTLSPDGQQVAFMRNDGSGPRLYVQFLSGNESLPLAEAVYGDPAWDPLGERIAYMRTNESGDADEGSAGLQIRTISPLGTDDRLLATTSSTTTGLDWSPDGRFVAYADHARAGEPSSIFLVSLDDGEKRRLTFRPGGEATLDQRPAFSPDGRHLAFVSTRVNSGGLGEVYVQALDEDGSPDGDPRLLVSPHGFLYQVEWTADASAVVYSFGPTDDNLHLMIIPVDGWREPSRLAVGERARDFSIVGDRLVYSQRQDDVDLWRIGGPTAEEPGEPERWSSSTKDDFAPHYSPDGASVAFISGRTGFWELWVADADGSNPRQLSDLGHAIFPQWSPRGDRILFSSVAPQRGSDVWVVRPEGGAPINLTEDEFDDAIPAWSLDGKSIYFQSLRASDMPWAIWRMTLASGDLKLITAAGGLLPRADARGVYVSRGNRLVRVAEEGGEATVAVDEPVGFPRWALWNDKVVYITRGEPGTAVIKIFDPATGTSREHAAVPIAGAGWVRLEGSLAVSPDGRSIVYSAKTSGGADLILIDNYR